MIGNSSGRSLEEQIIRELYQAYLSPKPFSKAQKNGVLGLGECINYTYTPKPQYYTHVPRIQRIVIVSVRIDNMRWSRVALSKSCAMDTGTG